jgi:Leucine-rich repeat (LRR) protein
MYVHNEPLESIDEFIEKELKHCRRVIFHIQMLRFSTLPASISKLTHLQEMRLSENCLVSLCPEISALTKLTILTVSNNYLATLPIETKYLGQLRQLCLSNNNLKELPAAIAYLTNLVSLHVEWNYIASIPSWISALTQLTALSVCHNKLTDLPSSLNALSQLNRLDVSYNCIINLPFLSTITDFTFGNRTDMSFGFFPPLLYTWTQLTSLFIRNVTYLHQELSLLTNLKWLLLDTNSSLIHLPIEFRFLTCLQNAETCVWSAPIIKFASKRRNERMEFFEVQHELYHCSEDGGGDDSQ